MSDMDDKTVFKATCEGDDAEASSSKSRDSHIGNDRTRITARTKNSVQAEEDRTRVQPPLGRGANLKDEPAKADTTQFTPRRRTAGDQQRTRIDIRRRAGTAVTEFAGQEPAPAASAAPAEYGTIKNRFVFEEVLGAGGMGIVYKARDLLKVEAQDRDPYVAIKVLSDEFKAHPEAFIALQRESRKTQRIAHPNIVNVYDFDRDGDTVFMTMEYMDGTPLDKLIGQYRSVGLPTETIHQILEGICAALIYAHEQNIIHSDFKPGNIFVTSNGTAKVFDFGIARAVAKAENREESKDDRTVFDAGNLGALTPAYASLEMLEGETPDIRDDVYALGCIAYELFTGEHPYNRMHADEAKRQKVKPKRISGISRKQWRAIEHALAFQRQDRTESVAAFWREFNQKSAPTFKIAAASLLVFGLAGGAYYQFKPEPREEFSELQFRSEIERNLRIELKKESLEALLAAAEFSSAWEAEVWRDVQELRQLLGADEWLSAKEASFYSLYVEAIQRAVQADQLKRAEELLGNAGRYSEEGTELTALESQIKQAFADREQAKQQAEQQRLALAEERRRARLQAEAEANERSEFMRALTNVESQLRCLGIIDMRDFEIALTKLRGTNSQQYAVEEPKITRLLARCIEHIGETFPERAEEAKVHAMRLFARNATIAGINIVAKDPCGSSLAGAGARGRGATCSDKSPDVQDPPTLVVIPGSANLKPFALGQFEVTVGQINEFCSATQSCSVETGLDSSLPANNISLATANGYLRWLSDKSGRHYRLPTLLEWQHAAHAEGGRVDSNRNCRLNSRGISKGNALIKASTGQKNRWGLVNHLGNVREWVSDRGGRHLAVGGSFETAMDECNVQNAVAHNGEADPITGFRVLREVDG